MKRAAIAIILLAVLWKEILAANYDPRCNDELPEVCTNEQYLNKFALNNGGNCEFPRKLGTVSEDDPKWDYYYRFLKCAKAAGIHANQIPDMHTAMQGMTEKTISQKHCSAVRHLCHEWDCDVSIPSGLCWRDGEKCWKFLTELNTDHKPSKCWKNILHVDKRELLKNHSSVIYEYVAYCGAPDVAFRRKLGYKAENEQLKVTGMAAVTSFCQNVDKWIIKFGYPLEADDTTTIMDLNVVVFHFMVFLIGLYVTLQSYYIAVRAKNWLREKCEEVRQDSRRKWTVRIKAFKERKEEEKRKAQPKPMDDECERMPGTEEKAVVSKSKNTKSKSKTTTKKSGMKRKGRKSISKSKTKGTRKGQKSTTTTNGKKKGKKSMKSKSKTSKTTGYRYRRPKTKAQIIRETREKAQAILDRQEKRKKSKESKDRKPVEQKAVEEQKTQKSEHVISVGKDGSKVQDKNSRKPSVPDMVIENTQESDETCRSRSAKPKTGKDRKKAITKKAKQPQPLSERTARDSDVPPSVKALNAQKKKDNKAAPKKNSGAIPSEKTAVDSETDRRKDNRKSAHVVKDAPKKAKGENLSEKTAVDSEADRKASRSKDVKNKITVPEATKNKSKKGKLVPAEKTSAKPEVARAKPKDREAKDNKEKKSGTKAKAAKGKDTPRKKKDSNEVVLSERTALGSEVETRTTEGSKPLTGTGAKPKSSAAGEKKAVAKEQQVSAPASKKKEKVAVVPKQEVKGTKREDGVGKADGNIKFGAEQDKKKGEMPKKK